MGTLAIDCMCTESQMGKILAYITKHLVQNSDGLDISDIDDEIEGFRVCVDFSVFNHKVEIENAEIQDIDWNVIPEDTAVLNSRLRLLMNDYNRDFKESYLQASQIRQDQYSGYSL